MRRIVCLLALPLLAVLLSGCSEYVEDYYYYPRPAVAEVPPTTQGAPAPVSTMASVVGIRRAKKDANLPLSVEILLRVDNNGPQEVTLDPHALELATAFLLNFQPPMTDPATPLTLGANQSVTIHALFPFPPHFSYDNTDMSSLQLRCLLNVGDRPIRQVIGFNRAIPYYYNYGPYYPNYYPYPYYGNAAIFYNGNFGGGHHH